jgi:hypothetical protein
MISSRHLALLPERIVFLITLTTGGYAAASPPATIFQASGLVLQIE